MDDIDFEDAFAGILFGSMVVLATISWLIQCYRDSRKQTQSN